MSGVQKKQSHTEWYFQVFRPTAPLMSTSPPKRPLGKLQDYNKKTETMEPNRDRKTNFRLTSASDWPSIPCLTPTIQHLSVLPAMLADPPMAPWTIGTGAALTSGPSSVRPSRSSADPLIYRPGSSGLTWWTTNCPSSHRRNRESTDTSSRSGWARPSRTLSSPGGGYYCGGEEHLADLFHVNILNCNLSPYC
ncbi:hypothetical protein LAZ67_1001789 [Cordylochernes scorpioides]|uniref:Uncharacterized protein n=1 Tax=Cordylochernes scorpioides TaxID=51811 RepID=A0ABY6JW15_9ARAC|nr:hypothetical protein LAZ67_1001789 [Cordylochernes scorpioides]